MQLRREGIIVSGGQEDEIFLGEVEVGVGRGLGFLMSANTTYANARRLSFGNGISSRAGSFRKSYGFKDTAGTHYNTQYHRGIGTQPIQNPHNWPVSSPGFFGFSLKTRSGQVDYGWIRMEYTESQNDLPDSITIEDLAFTTDGSPILAGETGEAPEPATGGLALLAAGAAGVAALRRKRATA